MSREKSFGESARTVGGYPWWISVAVILGAILLASGAVISKVNPSLLVNGEHITAGTRVFADYTFARDLALTCMLLFLLLVKARRMLAGIMVLIALIQIFDMIDDLIRGEFLLVPVVLVFACVFLIGASRLFGQPIWRIAVWRELDNHSAETR